MNFKIAVIKGDGIGPEIVDQSIKVLNAIAKRFNHNFQYTEVLMGACAIDATGVPLPDETLEVCKNSDAILFGAIGDPKYDNNPNAKVRPEQGLLKIRKELGLFANIRPVEYFPALAHLSPLKSNVIEGSDFVVIRELTGGIYFGEKGKSADGNTAFDNCTYSKNEIIRITKVAFDLAMKRRKHVTLVDKANVLETSRLWREVVKEFAAGYPEVTLEMMFVDNAAMQLIQNPRRFDVVLTENMFGDILTDEASVITGSIGLLPSASTGNKVGLYEPIHGSYPQAAGKNIANPIGTILSAALMLESALNLNEEAKAIRKAVADAIAANCLTEDLIKTNAKSTTEVGDFITKKVLESVPA
ncbi:MAG: 3-isopropylmalate dehydrogenase [Flavobacteriales bacterium]